LVCSRKLTRISWLCHLYVVDLILLFWTFCCCVVVVLLVLFLVLDFRWLDWNQLRDIWRVRARAQKRASLTLIWFFFHSFFFRLGMSGGTRGGKNRSLFVFFFLPNFVEQARATIYKNLTSTKEMLIKITSSSCRI